MGLHQKLKELESAIWYAEHHGRLEDLFLISAIQNYDRATELIKELEQKNPQEIAPYVARAEKSAEKLFGISNAPFALVKAQLATRSKKHYDSTHYFDYASRCAPLTEQAQVVFEGELNCLLRETLKSAETHPEQLDDARKYRSIGERHGFTLPPDVTKKFAYLEFEYSSPIQKLYATIRRRVPPEA